MTRSHLPLFLAAALATSGSLAPAVVHANAAEPFYVAQLVEPADEDSVIAGGVVFRCEGTRCAAPRSSDRTLRVCSDLRRRVGSVAGFSAGGEVMSDADLARCNG